MFSISSSGRCEGYQIQILAFPTPDGCDAIGEGDGTETDAPLPPERKLTQYRCTHRELN